MVIQTDVHKNFKNVLKKSLAFNNSRLIYSFFLSNFFLFFYKLSKYKNSKYKLVLKKKLCYCFILLKKKYFVILV